MSDQTADAGPLVPEPALPPAEEELSADEILGFDPASAVTASVEPPMEMAQPVAAGVSAVGVVSAPVVDTTAVVGVGAPELPDNRVEVSCPSCGAVGTVDFTRRDSGDFCAACDFPLFWSRDRIVMPSSEGPDASALRRLPGTAGRAALASLLCPSCAEPNPATGITCVRCGADLHPKPVAEPVVVAPALEPVVEAEPEPEGRPWWPILVAGALAIVALAVVLIILYA
jgi:hypothetical protein